MFMNCEPDVLTREALSDPRCAISLHSNSRHVKSSDKRYDVKNTSLWCIGVAKLARSMVLDVTANAVVTQIYRCGQKHNAKLQQPTRQVTSANRTLNIAMIGSCSLTAAPTCSLLQNLCHQTATENWRALATNTSGDHPNATGKDKSSEKRFADKNPSYHVMGRNDKEVISCG